MGPRRHKIVIDIVNIGSVYGLSYGGAKILPGARPTKHISIEFEIRWKFKTL